MGAFHKYFFARDGKKNGKNKKKVNKNVNQDNWMPRHLAALDELVTNYHHIVSLCPN